ncbi:MAG: hypothetical protein ACLPSF_10685 [Methylocella sp.]
MRRRARSASLRENGALIGRQKIKKPGKSRVQGREENAANAASWEPGHAFARLSPFRQIQTAARLEGFGFEGSPTRSRGDWRFRHLRRGARTKISERLERDDFGLKQSKTMNVIDFQSLERHAS